MRAFREPTYRNFLRKPMLFGVPMTGMLALIVGVTALQAVLSFLDVPYTPGIVTGTAVIGYAVLRILSRILKPGWEESLWFRLEQKGKPKSIEFETKESLTPVVSPDCLSEQQCVYRKEELLQQLSELNPGEELRLALVAKRSGSKLFQVDTKSEDQGGAIGKLELPWGLSESRHCYSLYSVPAYLDPLLVFDLLRRIDGEFVAAIRIQSVDEKKAKRQVEYSRRRTIQQSSGLTDIDSDVTFQEASKMLEGISRGTESLYEISLVVSSQQKLDLPEDLFVEEKDLSLPLYSVLGLRKRFHRSLWVRGTTAVDLIPNFFDPKEESAPLLATKRGYPLYFRPDDSRLESLHWLVSGSTGSGKSFFTGVVLKRMIEAGANISVIFIDYNRSFSRFVRSKGEPYIEPENAEDFALLVDDLLMYLDRPGRMTGIELSEIPESSGTQVAERLFGAITKYLRQRKSSHVVYFVFDECRRLMIDVPFLTERLYRESRKLNGAVIGITTSLSHFITEANAQSIIQCAPIRIFLRQDEDLSAYQRALDLNDKEIALARSLTQRKGKSGQCIVKTPFASMLAELSPTEEEHRLFRTDNLREEYVSRFRTKQLTEVSNG